MALGKANSSAQSRGKNKAVVVKRRKEVVAAKHTVSIVATALTGESAGGAACALAGSISFNKEYFIISYSGSVGAYIPDVGSKVYTRQRINDRYALTEGLYLFKVNTANYVLTIGSDLTVTDASNCSR